MIYDCMVCVGYLSCVRVAYALRACCVPCVARPALRAMRMRVSCIAIDSLMSV